MATLTQTQKFKPAHLALIKKWDEIIELHMPRRCMVLSVGLLLAGLAIPACMLLQLLPVTFLLGFASLGLIGTGSVMVLVFCGEI